MATRTFYLKGKAFSDSGDVSLTVNFNGSQVFSGTVPTTNAEYTTSFENEVLCSWTFDSTLNATVPVSVAVTGGTAGLSINEADYATQESVADLGNPPEAEYTQYYKDVVLELDKEIAGPDTRSNIMIDGTSVVVEAEDQRGWVYTVESGSTITFDQEIDSSIIPAEFR